MFTVTRAIAPVRTQVQGGLRDMIVDGQLQPGDRLIEREICESLGVSRPLVREAMRSLEAEGLLQAGVNGGLFVRKLSLKEAHEIYVTRGVLEGGAALSFVQTATDADITVLCEQVEVIEQALRSGDLLAVRRGKNAFYDVLMERCGNTTIAEMLRLIYGRIQLLRSVTLAEQDRMAAAVLEIRLIYNAIEARNGEEASKCATQHIANAAQAMKVNWLKALNSEGNTDPTGGDAAGGDSVTGRPVEKQR